MGNRTIFIYIITQVFSIISCLAQEENSKSIKQQTDFDADPINSRYNEVARMDKDSLLIMPDSIKGNLVPANGTGYVALPWGYRPFRSGLFGWDYAAYGQLGDVQTFSTHQTLPTLGAYTYVRFMYPFQFTDKLSANLGFFLSKYALNRRINNDFGLNVGVKYVLMPNVSLNFEHQQSFRQDIIGIPSHISPLFPNTNTNLNLQIEPVKGVKMKVGYLNE